MDGAFLRDGIDGYELRWRDEWNGLKGGEVRYVGMVLGVEVEKMIWYSRVQ